MPTCIYQVSLEPTVFLITYHFTVILTHPQHNMSQHGICLSHMLDVRDVLIPLSVLSRTGDLSMYPNYPNGMGHIFAVDETWLLLYLHLSTK
jgi:hypothetical protein